MRVRDAFIFFVFYVFLLSGETKCEIERVHNSPYPSSESPASTTIYVLQTSDYSQSELLCLLVICNVPPNSYTQQRANK